MKVNNENGSDVSSDKTAENAVIIERNDGLKGLTSWQTDQHNREVYRLPWHWVSIQMYQKLQALEAIRGWAQKESVIK